MVLSLNFILGFIGIAVCLLIAIIIFSEVSDVAQQLQQEKIPPQEELAQQKVNVDNAFWIVIAILPITLLIFVFRLLSGTLEFGLRRKSKRILLEFLCLIGLAKKIKVNGK